VTTNRNGNPEAVALLERAIAAIKSAETLFFEARILDAAAVVQKMYEQLKLPVPVRLQKYNSWDCAGVSYVRVETSMAVGAMNPTKLFIKNRDGIWDVLPRCVVEVSTVFKRDNLLGTFPFLRLFSIPQYPYELSIDESPGSREQIVVKGRLAAKPLHCEDDIASECSYTIDTENGHPGSLNEKTFMGRSLHLMVDKLELDGPINKQLFELPDRPKLTMASMVEYVASQGAQYMQNTCVSRPVPNT